MDSSVPIRDPERGLILSYGQRLAVAMSIIAHRPATQETCDLAIRALQGYDVIAEAGL